MSDLPARLYGKATLDDGQVFSFAVDERDMRRYDMTYKAKGWPAAGDAAFLFQGFIVAACLIRQGDVTGDPATLMDRIVTADVERSETVNPTGAAPGNDS